MDEWNKIERFVSEKKKTETLLVVGIKKNINKLFTAVWKLMFDGRKFI